LIQDRVPSVAIDGVPDPVLFRAPTALFDARQPILAARLAF